MPSAPAARAAPRPRRAAARLVALAALAAPALVACGDDNPFQGNASLDTQGSIAIIYPVSTARAELPVAIDFSNLRAARPALRNTGTPNFDVALDLDPTGRVRVLLPQYVLIPLTGVPRIGTQTTDAAYDDAAIAPSRNYRYDTVTVANVGQTVFVQTPGLACTSTVPLYAKFIVDSVVGAERAMYVRMRLDPNCGFRSLAPGRPEE